jgi:hypothetical protein
MTAILHLCKVLLAAAHAVLLVHSFTTPATQACLALLCKDLSVDTAQSVTHHCCASQQFSSSSSLIAAFLQSGVRMRMLDASGRLEAACEMTSTLILLSYLQHHTACCSQWLLVCLRQPLREHVRHCGVTSCLSKQLKERCATAVQVSVQQQLIILELCLTVKRLTAYALCVLQ